MRKATRPALPRRRRGPDTRPGAAAGPPRTCESRSGPSRPRRAPEAAAARPLGPRLPGVPRSRSRVRGSPGTSRRRRRESGPGCRERCLSAPHLDALRLEPPVIAPVGALERIDKSGRIGPGPAGLGLARFIDDPVPGDQAALTRPGNNGNPSRIAAIDAASRSRIVVTRYPPTGPRVSVTRSGRERGADPGGRCTRGL